MYAALHAVVGFGVGAAVVAIGISVFAGGVAKQRLDTAATQIKRQIETNGVYDSAEKAKITDYLKRNKINATVTVKSLSGKDTADMNLGDSFSVILKKDVRIGAGGIGFTPITLVGSDEGMSEVYRK